MTGEFTLLLGSSREAIAACPPDETLAQMGRLMFRLGHFESFLALAARGWMPDDEVRPTLPAMAKKPMNEKIRLAREHSAAITDAGLRRRLLVALDTAERAYAVRNDVLHGSWQVDPIERCQVVINLAKPEGEQRTVVDVNAAALDADTALRELLTVLLQKAGLPITPDMLQFFSQKPPWSAEN